MEQLCSRWTDFHEILYLSIFSKPCPENSSFLKIGQKQGVPLREDHLDIFDHISLISS